MRPPFLDLRTLPPRHELRHDLGAALPRFAAIRRRFQLRQDPLYRRHRSEIHRVLRGFEWDTSHTPAPPSDPSVVRAVAWNIERGKRFDALMGVIREHRDLAEADLLLLTELDIGMGRSDNRNIPRELARELGLHYIFANQHLVLARGDKGEQDVETPNTLALHGCALLSRYPIRRFTAVTLPEYLDTFRALEKRLGAKRALLVEVELPSGPLGVVVVHLDPFAPARHRAAQLDRVLAAAEHFHTDQLLLGGDLNTTTYDFGSSLGLGLNVLHKLVRFGFEGTIRQYMTPEQVFERPIFRVLARHGLEVDGYNDRSRGTIYYDVSDPEVVAKSLGYVPRPVVRWLRRRLEPYGGVVPLRFDWFAGRGLSPRAPRVIERPCWGGSHVSDHNPIVVDIDLPARAG
ncbi:MAG TPA: endonuclease/exonuclease/phosphatase family protein [Nannocystaceae bacterium]|nr:endonuclease/exonuclease/phosphatase family protein [Nannocystaceae bacterium]